MAWPRVLCLSQHFSEQHYAAVCFYMAEVAFDMQIKQDGQYRVFPFGAFQSFHSGTPLLSVPLALGFLL